MIKPGYKPLFYSILLLALCARIIFVFFTDFNWYGADSEMYLSMGKAIAEGNPVSYFPNGYPLLISIIIFFFRDNTPVVLVITNVIAQLASLVLAERILYKLEVEEKFRLVILFILAFYPAQLSGVRFIMTEPLSVFLIMLSIYFFIDRKYYLAGFSAYIAYSFRPSLILFAPLVVVYQLYQNKKSKAGLVTLGFVTGLILFFLSDATGITSPPGNRTQNILVSIQSYGYNINHSFSNFNIEQIENPLKTYINFALTNPLVYLKQRFLSLWSLWGPYVPSDLGLIGMVLHGLRFPFFIAAVMVFIFRKHLKYENEYLLILFLPVISITGVHFFFFSTQRHQFSAEPFVVIFGLIGLQYLWHQYQNKIYNESKSLNG